MEWVEAFLWLRLSDCVPDQPRLVTGCLLPALCRCRKEPAGADQWQGASGFWTAPILREQSPLGQPFSLFRQRHGVRAPGKPPCSAASFDAMADDSMWFQNKDCPTCSRVNRRAGLHPSGATPGLKAIFTQLCSIFVSGCQVGAGNCAQTQAGIHLHLPESPLLGKAGSPAALEP